MNDEDQGYRPVEGKTDAPVGGFADMGAGQPRSEADIAPDSPAYEQGAEDAPESVSEAKDVIDATDDFEDEIFDGPKDDPANDIDFEADEPVEIGAEGQSVAREPLSPDDDWRGRERRMCGLNAAAQNNQGRCISPDDIIEEAAMYADFIENGYGER